MPRLERSFPHKLGREAATTRIKEALEKEKVAKANIVTAYTENWVTDYEDHFTMQIFGHAVDGEMCIEDNCVRILLNLPFVALMVKGMIEKQLEDEMKKLLS